MSKTQAFVILEIMTPGLEGLALTRSSVEPGSCIESLRNYRYNALMGKNLSVFKIIYQRRIGSRPSFTD